MSKIEAVIERLNEFRKVKGYSINALSKELDLNQKTLNNQLSGVTALSVDTIYALIVHFPEVSAEWLLRGDEPMLRESCNLRSCDSGPAVVELLERELAEEKKRNKEYWNMIQQLVSK